MTWGWALFYIAVAVYAISTIPTPETQPPATIDELNVPTVSASKEIPILFGSKTIKSPNIVWYGDLKATAIRGKGGKK